MKRLVLIAILTSLIPASLQAQQTEASLKIFGNEDEKIFHGGFTFGGNISEVIGDAYHGYHKVGWHVGPGVVGKLKEKMFGMSLEMLYSQKGSRGVKTIYSGYVGEMFERYYLDLNYVEIPFQALLFLPDKPLIFGLGGSYSRLLKVKESVSTDQPVYIDPAKYPFLKEDWCWLANIKYQFWRGWFVGARYSRSLKPVRTRDKVPPNFGSGNQTNTYFTFSVTYLVP